MPNHAGVTAREPPRRGLLVVNPAARGRPFDRAGAVARRAGPRLALATLVTAGPGHAAGAVAEAVAAAADPFDLVLSVGGDGTAGEVAAGLARLSHRPAPSPGSRPVPALLVVPAGTGNSVYRALWADRPWEEVLDDVLGPGRWRRRSLDLVRVVEADRLALLGASAGFLADVVAASEELDGVDGRERYQAAAAVALGRLQPYPGRVLVDGEPLHDGRVTLAAVGGARHRAGTFEILPGSCLDDGLLDVCVVGAVAPERLAELAGLVASGLHLGQPEVAYGRGTRVVLERDDGPLDFEHDGDRWAGAGGTVTLAVVPGAVPVCAPLVAPAG